jgi:hypothetical protein
MKFFLNNKSTQSINRVLIISILIVFLLHSISGIVYAEKTPTTKDMMDKGIYYYDPGDNKCIQDQYDSSEASQNSDKIYKSGIDPNGPFILEMFAIHILKASAAKRGEPEENFVTKQHVVALVAFAIGEGGDINNQSVFNPLNLSYKSKDIKSIPWLNNGNGGEQAYGSFDEGVEAYARQINMGYQSRLGKVLSQKESTAADFMYALTHYEKYKGNAAWAGASLPIEQGGIGVDKYYQGRLDFVKTVKNNYEKTAGLVIGTPELEQQKGMYKPSLLQYKDLGNDSVDDYTSSNNTNACDDSNSSQGTAGAMGWELSGPNKMVVYRQADPKWSGKPYICGTIGRCGCWVVTTAIIISTLKNKKINPAQLLDKYGAVYYPTVPAEKEGLNSDNIGTNFDKAEKTLKEGGLIAAYFHAGPFTTIEHMMVIRKVTTDGKFLVYDLRGPDDPNNTKSYTREYLMTKANLQYMFAISKKDN